LVLWDYEEAPALYFKGSKPEAVPAGWSLFEPGSTGSYMSFVTKTDLRAILRGAAAGPTLRQ